MDGAMCGEWETTSKQTTTDDDEECAIIVFKSAMKSIDLLMSSSSGFDR